MKLVEDDQWRISPNLSMPYAIADFLDGEPTIGYCRDPTVDPEFMLNLKIND